MACEELARLLSCLLKRGQSARCCDDLAEFESRLFAELLHWKNSFRWFRFLLLRYRRERCIKSKCPSWRGQAPGRPRCQGRGVGVHRSEAQSLDRRSGRIRRSFSAGRAEERLRSRDSGVCSKNLNESGEGGRHLMPRCGLERIPTPTVQNRRRHYPPRKRAALANMCLGILSSLCFRAACIVSLSASFPPPFHFVDSCNQE